MSKKAIQKENYDKTHYGKLIPELCPGQDVLFLSPSESNTYIHGTIISPTSKPISYIIEAQEDSTIEPDSTSAPSTIIQLSPFQDHTLNYPQHKSQWKNQKKALQKKQHLATFQDNKHQNVPSPTSHQTTPNCTPRPHIPKETPIKTLSTPTNSTHHTMDQYLAQLAATNDQCPQYIMIHTKSETDTNTSTYISTPSSPMQSESSSNSSMCHTTSSNNSDNYIFTISIASDRQNLDPAYLSTTVKPSQEDYMTAHEKEISTMCPYL